MKTIAAMTILASSMLMAGTTEAVAQCSRTRPYYRPVITYPQVAVRPVVSRPVHGTQPVYGAFSHIDDLAVELEQLARDILWEMHFNYTHNVGYDVTYAEAYDILSQAKYIHQNEHLGNRHEIARVVVDLDRLFHHLQDDVRRWRPSHSHFVGGGSLFDKLAAMEDTLHHLMQDVGMEASTTDTPAPNLGSGDPPPPSLSNLRLP